MSKFTVTKTRIHAGIWEGVITADDPGSAAPQIDVTHLDKPVPSFAVTKDRDKGNWNLRIAIPPELLADGVQVFVISDKASGEKMDSFTIVTGEPLEDDIRAEVELLRAELDMLKRAFRRHCLETA
ncbi:MAG: hypothetical protein WBN04_03305 [Paracoccaceae bacterium]